MKRAVVTGGCGFIGSYVVRKLLEERYVVTVFDNLHSGKKENLPEGVTFVEGDIQETSLLENTIQKGDVVFHLAALTSVPGSIEGPFEYYETNVRGTYSVLEACRKKEAAGVVFSSSAAVYGNQEGEVSEASPILPESPYALQKYVGEQIGFQYARLFNLPFVALRYFNVYGQGNHEEGSYAPVTARFLKSKREGKPLTIIGKGEQTRDFIHVEDVARANVLAADLVNAGTSEAINICSGNSYSILSIADTVGGEKEFAAPRNEIQHSKGSPMKAKEILGFVSTIPFEEGLRDLLQS